MLALAAVVLAATVQRIPAFQASAFAAAPDGALYAAARYGDSTAVFRVTTGGPVKMIDTPRLPSAMVVASDGSLWLTFDDRNGIYRAVGSELVKVSEVRAWRLAATTDGAVWYLRSGVTTGVGRIGPDGSSSWAVPQWAITNLAPGVDGTVWGMWDSGVIHVGADGSIIASTETSRSPHLTGGMAASSDGGAWVSAFQSGWLIAIDAAGRETATITLPRGGRQRDFFVSRSALYVVTDTALLRYEAGSWSAAGFDDPMPAPFDSCYHYDEIAAMDEGGRVWVTEFIPATGWVGAMPPPPCPYPIPDDVLGALVRLSDSAFVPLDSRKRAAGH